MAIAGRIWPHLPNWLWPRPPNSLWPLDVNVSFAQDAAALNQVLEDRTGNPFALETVIRRGKSQLIELNSAPPEEKGNG